MQDRYNCPNVELASPSHQDNYAVMLNKVFLDSTELISVVVEEFFYQMAAQELKLDRQSICGG